MKFLDIRTDFAFKKVFGSEDSKIRLISFLNSLLEFNDGAKIADLTIVDPYNIPMLKGMKDSFVDVKAVLDNGSKVIIEMQILNHSGFEQRVLYNAAKNYSLQLIEGEDYNLLNPIIALTIVDFNMFEHSTEVVSKYKLLEKNKFIEYSDDLELVFIELPKFNKSLEQLEDIKDQWIYFIKNAGSLAYVPDNMSIEIQSAFAISNTANLSTEELELQYKKKEFISIQRLALEKAINDGLELGIKEGLEQGLQQGLEQGLQQGIEQGIRQSKLEMAKKLLDSGVSALQVASITGLRLDEFVK